MTGPYVELGTSYTSYQQDIKDNDISIGNSHIGTYITKYR